MKEAGRTMRSAFLLVLRVPSSLASTPTMRTHQGLACGPTAARRVIRIRESYSHNSTPTLKCRLSTRRLFALRTRLTGERTLHDWFTSRNLLCY
jgi:hypothetical protein